MTLKTQVHMKSYVGDRNFIHNLEKILEDTNMSFHREQMGHEKQRI